MKPVNDDMIHCFFQNVSMVVFCLEACFSLKFFPFFLLYDHVNFSVHNVSSVAASARKTFVSLL